MKLHISCTSRLLNASYHLANVVLCTDIQMYSIPENNPEDRGASRAIVKVCSI
jgi:hypothetical protein